MDVRKIILIYEMTPIKVSFLHIGRIESFFVESIDIFRGVGAIFTVYKLNGI